MISVPDDKGRVAVLYPSTGKFTVLKSEGMEHIKTVPVWRYPKSLDKKYVILSAESPSARLRAG